MSLQSREPRSYLATVVGPPGSGLSDPVTLEGASLREIARKLGIAPNTVRAILAGRGAYTARRIKIVGVQAPEKKEKEKPARARGRKRRAPLTTSHGKAQSSGVSQSLSLSPPRDATQ